MWLAALLIVPRMIAPMMGTLWATVAVGSSFGVLAGVGFQRLTGSILEANGYSHMSIFVMCGLAYVTTLPIAHLRAPSLEPARLGER